MKVFFLFCRVAASSNKPQQQSLDTAVPFVYASAKVRLFACAVAMRSGGQELSVMHEKLRM